MRIRLGLAGISALALLWAEAAVAQTPAAESGASTEQLDNPAGEEGEVVVTARRRTENLQTTPLSGSVLTGTAPSGLGWAEFGRACRGGARFSGLAIERPS